MLKWGVDKRTSMCLAISLLSAGLLFLAKLTGLICFAANVLAVSLLDVAQRGRVTSPVFGMWAGSAISAVLFLSFWPARDWGPVTATWLAIWFPIAGTAFSGFAGLHFVYSVFVHSSEIMSDLISFHPGVASDRSNYVLGPLGLLFIMWIWIRLRDTRYREMAILLLAVAAIYTAALGAIFFFSSTLYYFEERHMRYSGIIIFLLFLVAMDQWRVPAAKRYASLIVALFACFGLVSYARGTLELLGGRYYDPLTHTSQLDTPPVVLEYLRSDARRHSWQSPIAVLQSPKAAIALPSYRILLWDVVRPKAGRTDRIYVVVQEKMVQSGVAEELLRSFSDYELGGWREMRLNGMVVYSQ
jgi:hypothetical protein